MKLGKLVDVKTGKLDANAAEENGKYPFFTTAKEVYKINQYSFDNEAVLVAGNGDLNVKYYNGKFDAYQRTYVLSAKEENNIHMKYLYYFMDGYLNTLRKQAIGCVIKYIKLENITGVNVYFPSMETQAKIAKILDKSTALITKRKTQIDELDNLIRSVFLQIFGEPSLDQDLIPLSEIFTIIDGDRGKFYPKNHEFYEKEYCLFLNAKNVTKDGFCFINNQFIKKSKDEELRKGKLVKGDVVLTTRGTVGNIAYYSDDIEYENIRINSGMVILRKVSDNINLLYFIILVRYFDLFSKSISGSAQPQLPISVLKDIKIKLPKMEQQTQFAEIVEKIQSQKFLLQKSLVELEIQHQALMQKAFNGELV